MSKYLKKYNEETQEWEIISAPDVSVTQVLSGGTPITDTNVNVTDYHYQKETGDTKLDETLSVISDDISMLKRNVSWLAEHGGGGSGSGGGGTSSFGIVINSPVIENGKAYINGTSLKVEFMITGGSEGDICTYAYQFDSEALTDYKELAVNTTVTLSFELSASTLTSHSIILRATNPYGNTITPKSFNIYLSTLSVVFDTDTAGEAYKDGVYNIMQNTSHAYIPLIVTNGLEGANIIITAKRGSDSTFIELKSVSAGKSKRQIDFWNLVTKETVETGIYYVVTISAESTISGEKGASSESFTIRIKVINPSELTISVGINGVNTDETINVPLDSILNYNFKVYAPADISRVYYAAKLVNGSNSYLILGKYYDDTLHETGVTSYMANDNIAVETTVSSQYNIDTIKFKENDNVQLSVKIWSTNDGTKTTAITKNLLIVAASNDIFPRQIQKRDDSSLKGDTMLASWNRSNAVATSKNKWTSYIEGYDFLSTELSAETSVTIDMNVFNANDASGIKIENYVPYLRLQNYAYAKIDFSKYEKELAIITNSENSNNQGFTFSLSVNADKHTDTNHTIFLWGKNNSDGTLNNGIRVDVNKIYWYIIEETAKGNLITHTLSCNFACEERNSIDFSFTKGTSSVESTARIYVNGILNAAINLYKISNTYTLPNEAYIGVNFANNTLSKYSDINFYDFSVYTKTLNDFQIIINGKNSRLLGPTTSEEIIADYKSWKTKNFIKAKESDPSIPESVFFNENDYKNEFDSTLISNISQQSNIPTLSLYFGDSSDFTSTYFYSKRSSQDTASTFDCQGTYYDPETQRTVNGINLKVSLQGTSTLGYRIKNLEMYINEYTTIQGVSKVKLFQPKKEWMPESQFTLKADVVDSAHANNAVLGEWINNSGVFDNNPAMANFNANTRPLDVDDSGNTHYHVKSGTTEEIGYYEDVTIKHTLEGFPILLFIKFGGAESSKYYNFVGIYSFNLGRYSYYNMGMKFLKSFSRRSDSKGEQREACPKLINYYEETPSLGSINESDVYSFEFGNAGNLQIADYPVWSQYDKTVVKTYGDFKYPSEVGDTIWTNLCQLFKDTAEFKIDSYYGDIYSGYDNKNYYQYINGNYVSQGWTIPQDVLSYEDLKDRLNIKNAAAYFIVANAFGMTDSLGKNLTLRTWNGGATWWPCFYDMDTALGLTNDGSEDNPITVAIDKVSMTSDTSTQTTITGTTYHDSASKYAAYLSKLWGILRCRNFLYADSKTETPYYEEIWNNLRKTGAKLSKSSNFTNIMAERIGTCGELIYNYDYNSKYIQDTSEQEEGAAAAITFLHGTRINFVKDWLTKHFYFLDGLFDANRLPSLPTYEDSPYNSDIFTVTCFYDNSLAKLSYTVQVTTPSFIGITIGNDAYEKFYISEANKDTIIYLNNGTSSNSQITIKGASLLSYLEGLQGGFQNISSTNQAGVVKSLNEFNANNSSKLSSDSPFNEKVFLSNGKSSLESVNLNHTTGANLTTYKVNLENFDKLLKVDISNSDVTSLSLPETSLQTLLIYNSKITDFKLVNQNIINNVNFEGCDNLNTITFEECNAISALTISNKQNLNTFSILDCSGLTSLTISGNPSLTKIEISNCNNLKELVIDSCKNKDLQITITGNEASLERLSISNIESSNIIKLPNKVALSNVSALTISNCYKIAGWKFADAEIETYGEDDDNVFDLSPFTSLEGYNLKLNYLENLKYLRVSNNEDSPIKLYNQTITNCKSLVRIFGHIGICEAGIFNGYTGFSIGSSYVPTSNTDTPVFNTDTHATNISLFTGNLSSTFASTKCNINDAYYVLHLCDTGTTNLYALFNNCSEIETTYEEPLSIYTFGKCVNVTNINSIFGGSCNISGFLEPELLEPFILNSGLTEFDSVFSGNYWMHTDDASSSLFPEGNSIQRIVNFNPLSYYENEEKTEHYETQFRDTTLLNNLTELVSIDSSFNNCQIDFSYETYDATELFKYNTKLLNINNSFNISYGYGSLGNIFGGYSSDVNLYPRNLSSVTHSFIIKDGYHDYELYEGGGNDKMIMPIGDSLLSSICNTIVYITGKNPGENNTYTFNDTNNSGSFTGNGLLKYIPNFNYSVYTEDCSNDVFPYKIFENCKSLKECPGLFERVENFKKDDNDNFVSINTTLPNNIFKDTINLENISHMFADMGVRINYTLNGNGFKDNHIINADYLFANTLRNETFDSKLIGQIPFKLLYQEISGSTSTQEGITLANAIACGINVNTANTYSDISALTEEECSIGEEYIVFNDENNEGKISKYKVTGFTESSVTIWEKLELGIEGTVPATATITSYASETIHKINSTIKTMARVFEGIDSSAVTSYTATISSYEDLVEDNPDYSPILFIVEDGKYRINEKCSLFKKKWNKYIFDNTTTFHNYITSTDILNKVDDYSNKIVNSSLIPEEFISGYVKEIQHGSLDKFSYGSDGAYANMNEENQSEWKDMIMTNYICAPDIFRYCISKKPTINYAFNNSSSEMQYNDTFYINGLRGTIPSFIFEPLTEVTELIGIFSNCGSLYPYNWHYVYNNVETIGTMYSPNLFKGLNSLYNVSKMFQGNRIWGRTKVTGIFNTLSKLYTVSELWATAKWLERETTGSKFTTINVQLDADIFKNNSNLNNISSMLARSYQNSVYTITFIVNKTNNPNLADCSSFMEYAQGTHGNAPELWTWDEYQLYNYSKAYYGIVTSQIDNYNKTNFEKFMRG